MDVAHFIAKATQEKLIKTGSIENTHDFLKEADLKLAAVVNSLRQRNRAAFTDDFQRRGF